MPDYLETRLKHSYLATLLVCLATSVSTFAADPFPQSPDPELTPGSLCQRHSELRYPERIPYCNRSVGKGLKQDIIETYDDRLGYEVGEMNRGEFKIDHYIPLCMGGSNVSDNLWPQHRTVYTLTDPLEQIACDKMAQGRLRQAEAVELIKRAKANPPEAPEITKQVREM